MKRILISILSSAVLVFGYFLSLIIFYKIHPISFDILYLLLLPINVPYNIYKSIFGFYYGNPMIIKVLNFGTAILLYAIPLYIAFTLFERFKGKPKTQGIMNPPEPPIF